MVKQEIVNLYGYPAAEVAVVYNGVPFGALPLRRRVGKARKSAEGVNTAWSRMKSRRWFSSVSGWARKGLRFRAPHSRGLRGFRKMRLLVAGRGNRAKYRSRRAKFLGVVQDSPCALRGGRGIFLLPTIYDPVFERLPWRRSRRDSR